MTLLSGLFRRAAVPAACTALFLFAAGCGPSAKELARREQQRLYREQYERMQAAQRAEAEAARAAAAEAARAAEEARRGELARLESDADAAAKAGRLNGALEAYRKVLGLVSGDPDADLRVRTKLIAVAVAMPEAPALPEEARRRAVRAQTFVKSQQAAGYAPAAAELEQAVALAPWWGDGYYNLGLMKEGAEDYEGAIRALKLCLLADPKSPNADAVQTKVYELEVLAEQDQRVRALAGTWRNAKTGNTYEVTMDGKSFKAVNKNNWVIRASLDGNALDGTITVPAAKGWDNNDCWTPEYTVPAGGRLAPDWTSIRFTFMENRYNASFWRITGSGPNNTGHKDGECTSVTLTGTSPDEIQLVR